MTPQTRFHRHWHVKARIDSRTTRLLRAPLKHNRDLKAVEESRFVYGPCQRHSHCWTISLLGLLHGLTGLTLEIKP